MIIIVKSKLKEQACIANMRVRLKVDFGYSEDEVNKMTEKELKSTLEKELDKSWRNYNDIN